MTGAASPKTLANGAVSHRDAVITATYLGATDTRTLDALVEEFGAQVRVNYESGRTRLHAKAWLLRRNTGFHTVYVGRATCRMPRWSAGWGGARDAIRRQCLRRRPPACRGNERSCQRAAAPQPSAPRPDGSGGEWLPAPR